MSASQASPPTGVRSPSQHTPAQDPDSRPWIPVRQRVEVGGPSQQQQQQQQPNLSEGPRKRIKVSRACDACRAKKKRCTGQVPCPPCRRLQVQCTYDASYSRGVAAPPSPAEDEPPTATPRAQAARPALQQARSSVAARSVHNSVPPSSLVADDRGGSPEPPSRRMSPEPAPATEVDGNYHGPSSAHSFLGRAWKRFDHEIARPPQSWSHGFTNPSQVSVFSFGDRVIPEPDISAFSWPHPAVTRELLRRYFDFAAPTYRCLHRPTVAGWLEQLSNQSGQPSLPCAAQAALLMVLAIASMYQLDMDGTLCDADSRGWQESESYYTLAHTLIEAEKGPPCLASIQARFLMVLYLLSSSRANQAWYTHGVTVQLIMTLGLHRRQMVRTNGQQMDYVELECQKRVFWCSYTVDKYLSVIIGRPRLLQDEDIDQIYPAHVNDEDLTPHAINPRPDRDCTMDAPIFHARLARILAHASREMYGIRKLSDQQRIESSLARTQEIAEWQTQLPPFISGAVQASTLIPVYRRQLTVLRLAQWHATMFVTRPLLLRDYARKLESSYALSYRQQLRSCVLAAKNVIDLILTFVQEGQLFPAFWYSQYIAFNALSIVYVYVLQVRKQRIPSQILCAIDDQPSVMDDRSLLQLAESAQEHLANATVRNAPAWRYSVLLDGLRCEVTGAVATSPSHGPMAPYHTTETHTPTIAGVGTTSGLRRQSGQSLETSTIPSHIRIMSDANHPSTYDGMSYSAPNQVDTGQMYSNAGLLEPMWGTPNSTGEMDLNFEFWPHFDSLPLSYPNAYAMKTWT